MPVEFERLMVQHLLDLLVEQVARLLPGLDAGISLVATAAASARGSPSAASSPAAARLELLQQSAQASPLLAAVRSRAAVDVDDLQADGRFAGLAADVGTGVRALASVPLHHAGTCLGALTLSRSLPGRIDTGALAQAQALADVAAAHLLSGPAQTRALVERAHHDALTGLPNRVLLQQRLERAARRAQRATRTTAVLFVDLDRFAGINDTYSHAVGDQLLIAVAQRLLTLVRPGDTLARVSGDEFVFLCEGVAHVRDVERLSLRIGAAFAVPFALEQVVVLVTASVGIAYAGPGEAVTARLVADADVAMSQAKRGGGGTHRVIDLTDARGVADRTRMAQDLHGAIGRGELALRYQPVVRSSDGLLVGVEALLRWTHPVSGPVPAPLAVEAAERSGLLGVLADWVLERACRDRELWASAYPQHPLTVSVNMSASQLFGRDVVTRVAEVLDRAAMDPTVLVLEITEESFLEDEARAVLAGLERLGVRIALDDFGSGYCSLGYLRRFPVDSVKIDRQFVADIAGDPASAAIVAAVTSLAHALGMAVTAEGVETEAHRDAISQLGCEFSQGYFYGGPMSAEALTDQLAAEGDRPLRLPLRAVGPAVPGH